MHPEQFEKIRSFLAENGQQELVGHLDGFWQEYTKLIDQVEAHNDQAEQDAAVSHTEAAESVPSGFPTHDASSQNEAVTEPENASDDSDVSHEPLTDEPADDLSDDESSAQAFQDNTKK